MPKIRIRPQGTDLRLGLQERAEIASQPPLFPRILQPWRSRTIDRQDRRWADL